MKGSKFAVISWEIYLITSSLLFPEQFPILVNVFTLSSHITVVHVHVSAIHGYLFQTYVVLDIKVNVIYYSGKNESFIFCVFDSYKSMWIK